jgi:hypothetical protein
MKANTSHLLRFTGFVIGAVLAIGLVLSGRMPQSQAEAPARLAMASQPTTTLGVSPAGSDFFASRSLAPGARPAQGSLEVSNYTGRRAAFRLRVRSPQRDLDSLVRVAVIVGGSRVYEGKLGELRSWTSRAVKLLRGQTRNVEFRAWVPMSVKTGYEARSAEVELEWKKARS